MKDKFEEAIKEITEKIKNLLYIKAIVEDADKDGNEIWRMEAELAGKVIDKYLPELINTLHQQAMKEEKENNKEKLKGILQSIKASVDYEYEITHANIEDIAKENDIKL